MLKIPKNERPTLAYYLLIPLVGALLVLLWSVILNEPLDQSIYKLLIHGVLQTTGIWTGCLVITWYFWYKYPWELYPLKHLLWEFTSICVYTVVFSFVLYRVQLYFGLIEALEGSMLGEIVLTIFITLFITTLHEAYFFYKNWVIHFSKSAKLEKANLEAKYETLKAQVNPHFLFNSLNSLQSLLDDNPPATRYIENLSEFMRYVLKSRDREVVLIREEIQMLEKYIHLQKLRFGENLQVNLNIDEKYFHYVIPPLSLQMIFENCIKHNIISKDKPLKVDIDVKGEEFICITNNLQKKIDVDSTGHGLANIMDRYKFLTNKSVNVKETFTIFTVCVPLVIADL